MLEKKNRNYLSSCFSKGTVLGTVIHSKRDNYDFIIMPGFVGVAPWSGWHNI